jgi:glycosyltransferase involved in cell wall biosynthesis
MSLSVIIPTWNRAGLLEKALESLCSQNYSTDLFEVIVVDNGSKDKTPAVAHSFHPRLPNLKYVHHPDPGLHSGRHRGLEKASGDILVYADDDISAFPTWLESIAESFLDLSVVLVGGKNLPLFEVDPPGWLMNMWEKERQGAKVLTHLSIVDLGDDIKEVAPFFVFGCNFSVRRNVLLDAGGFHPDAMPEDLVRYRGDGETHVSQYILDHGLSALYHPKASVFHIIPSDRMTKAYFCHRAFLQGISDSYTWMRSGKSRLRAYFRELNMMGQRLFSNRPMSTFLSHYSKGFWYHQNAVRNDPDLYQWVMKPSYLQ